MKEVAIDYGLDASAMPGPTEFKTAEYEFKAGRSIREIKRIMIDQLPRILGSRDGAAFAAPALEAAE